MKKKWTIDLCVSGEAIKGREVEAVISIAMIAMKATRKDGKIRSILVMKRRAEPVIVVAVTDGDLGEYGRKWKSVAVVTRNEVK